MQEMDTSIVELIKRTFDLSGQDIRTYSPLTLAYIGDAIFDLVVRSTVVLKANKSANNLHKTTVKYVKAEAQAKMIEMLMPELSEEEQSFYRRGKNSKPYSTAKNASVSDYHKATGFEALMGYLYLTGQTDRMLYLMKKSVDFCDGTK